MMAGEKTTDAKTIAAQLASIPHIPYIIKSMNKDEFYCCNDEDLWVWYMATAELFEGHRFMHRLSPLGDKVGIILRREETETKAPKGERR